MRTRYLLSIILVLTLTIAAVSAVHLYFFRTERLYLVDRQIEQIAAMLISSDFSYKKVEDHDEADEYLTELLGRTAINLVVQLRDRSGNILYGNENAELLNSSFSTEERWQHLEVDSAAVRVLTLPIAGGQQILQVGLVLNQNLLRWKIISQRMFAYMVVILFCVLLISLLLRRMLLQPLDRLVDHLRDMTRHLGSGTLSLESAACGSALAPLRASSGNDEFGRLIDAVQELSAKIRSNHQATQRWTAQMVHELKTPLTVVRNQLDLIIADGISGGEEQGPRVAQATREIDSIVSLIDEFLEWSLDEAEVGAPEELHAIKLGKAVHSAAAVLNTLHPGRIQVEIERDATLFAKPSHLNQLLNNLLVNALKYSPSHSPVLARVVGERVEIRDSGPGIPQEVLLNRGKPFNRGRGSRRGSGLGLAWVTTICKHYDWALDIDTGASGTRITLSCSEASSP